MVFRTKMAYPLPKSEESRVRLQVQFCSGMSKSCQSVKRSLDALLLYCDFLMWILKNPGVISQKYSKML